MADVNGKGPFAGGKSIATSILIQKAKIPGEDSNLASDVANLAPPHENAALTDRRSASALILDCALNCVR